MNSDNSKHRGDVALPRNFDDLHAKSFAKMLEADFRYVHGRLTCSDFTPVDPDYSHYFQTRRGEFNEYQGYINYYWGNSYSTFDAELSMDLTKHFIENGFYFKYNFDRFSNVSDDFYEYFVILTEKEYSLFHLTGTLAPSLELLAKCTQFALWPWLPQACVVHVLVQLAYWEKFSEPLRGPLSSQLGAGLSAPREWSVHHLEQALHGLLAHHQEQRQLQHYC